MGSAKKQPNIFKINLLYANYIFLVVSVLAAVSVLVVLVAAESTLDESDVPIAFLSELQAATDKDITKATKLNLNAFFMSGFKNKAKQD